MLYDVEINESSPMKPLVVFKSDKCYYVGIMDRKLTFDRTNVSLIKKYCNGKMNFIKGYVIDKNQIYGLGSIRKVSLNKNYDNLLYERQVVTLVIE
jgi:hypothetical protein